MSKNSFAVFIVTYGRPKEQITLETLRKQGYTGDIYAIVDNTDDTVEQLKKEHYNDFKDIIVFDKEEYYKNTDTMDNFHNLKTVVYARNFCLDIAKKLNLEYFMMTDDDMKTVSFRVVKDNKLIGKKVKSLDKVFEAMLKLLNNKQIYCLGFGNAGSYIGGLNGKYKKKMDIGSYNVYFLKNGDMRFRGTSDEDATFYVDNVKIGNMCYLVLDVGYDSYERGSNKGGLSEMYKELGTYVRSFYAVIANPAVFKLYLRKNKFEIKKSFNSIAPKLLNERWKK